MYCLVLVVAALLGAGLRAATVSPIASSSSSSLSASLGGTFFAGAGLLPDGLRAAGFLAASGGAEGFLPKKSITDA